jgi:hypothetical protein
VGSVFLISARLKRNLKGVISRAHSPVLDAVVTWLFDLQMRDLIRLSGAVRSLLLEALSDDPLRSSTRLPTIDLIIPFAEKDEELVPMCVRGALSNSRNRIENVVLIGPRGRESLSSETLMDLSSGVQGYGASLTILSDSEALSEELNLSIEKSRLHARNQGWLRQQLIKYVTVLGSSQDACLIVDADTVLLTPKTWVSSEGVQALAPAEWFREFWTSDVEKYLGVKKRLPFSYITHHQLIQKDILQALFGHGGDRLVEWLEQADTVVSEYDTYGSYVETFFSNRVRFCRFGNLEISRESKEWRGLSVGAPSNMSEHFSKANSVSLHHYL